MIFSADTLSNGRMLASAGTNILYRNGGGTFE